ncbi:MAG: phosphoenolpyruvate synthase [Acidimicrobiia bacterium]|nr:phosphoenolpyruvate synthase [Acidimicrobiia bacterium]
MILHLDAGTPQDPGVVGGKGCGLVRLLAAGVDVPDTWCVPPSVPDADLDTALCDLWERLAATGPPVLAVRSSASAEDLDDASFAGVYTTRLGVDAPAALTDAVRACRESLHAEAARAYRGRMGLGHDVTMAVLVQPMLDADVAGVMLTVNPHRPFAHEMVVDACYGIGEAVVSGATDPDHVVLDRRDASVREERVGAKATALRWAAGEGMHEVAVPDADRGRLCLTPAALEDLAGLARRVEAGIGPRRDVEWALTRGRLVALQDRPVTGLPPEHPDEVWTRRFGDEYLAEYSVPLGHTLMGHWISEYAFTEMARLAGRSDMDGLEPVLLHEGYSYMSGRYIAKLLEAVPADMRAEQAGAWFTPMWVERIRVAPFVPRHMLGWLAAPLRDRRAPLRRNAAALARHCARVESALFPKLAQDYTGLSPAQWQEQMAEVEALGVEHFRVIRWGMTRHNPLLHAALSDLLRRWASDDDAALYGAIVGGLPATRTARMNREVHALGLTARADAALRETLRGGLPYAEVRARHCDAGLWPEFDAFLRRHGHRSDSRDISRPRWSEAPDDVLALVRAQLHSDDPPPDPERLEHEAGVRREAALAEAEERAGRGVAGRARVEVLRRLARWTAVYTAFREDQRYHLDYVLTHLRRLVLEQGRRLAAAGVLGDASEVFFLEATELHALATGGPPPADLDAAIAARVAHWRKWRDRMPATYLFDGVETEGEVVEGDPAPGVVQGATDGVGAAHGAATGPVRVVHAIADLARVEPGDVLVAHNIDPGWTSVFPLLAALVTETGGVLSHGALLAREYGIPAVMGVSGATARWHEGEQVTVDGSRGAVSNA